MQSRGGLIALAMGLLGVEPDRVLVLSFVRPVDGSAGPDRIAAMIAQLATSNTRCSSCSPPPSYEAAWWASSCSRSWAWRLWVRLLAGLVARRAGTPDRRPDRRRGLPGHVHVVCDTRLPALRRAERAQDAEATGVAD